jgi:Tol biopolymer transport system component
VPGGPKQAVFAYKEEIDAWLLGQPDNGNNTSLATAAPEGLQLAKTEPNLPPPTSPSPMEVARSSRSQSLLTLKIALASLCLVSLILITRAMLILSRGPAVGRVHKITDDGHSKANVRTDGTTLYFVQSEGARGILMSSPMSGTPTHRINTPFSNVTIQDLSSDGKFLLVSSSEGILIDGPLWKIPVKDGMPQRIGDGICGAARWSPDQTKIACSRNTVISVMDGEGSHTRPIMSFPKPVGHLVWSPDGRRLRFTVADRTSYTFTTWEAEIMPDGAASQPQRLPMGPGCCMDWTWTHDGKAFVYIEVDSNNTSHLMVQPQKSSSAIELPINIGILGSVAPGSDSNTIYLSISDTARTELLKFETRRGVFEKFLPSLSAEFLTFSRNGQWMAYTDSAAHALWRSRTDGSQPQKLTSETGLEVALSSWSPDGRRIAFMARRRDQPWRIFLVGRDGGAIEEVSNSDDSQGAPTWSPDGKELVYGNVECEKTQNCWIRRINLATRTVEILPDSHGLRTARWSPDGKYIAALRFQSRELALFDVAKQRWRMLADSINGDNICWSSDSQYVYADSPRAEKPIIERVRIKDGERTTAVNLLLLQNATGQAGSWFALAPDNTPIVSHLSAAGEIYELRWTDR